MKKILLLIAVILLNINLFSQTVLLHQNVDDYTVYQKKKFGPNSRYYLYNFFSYNFFIPTFSKNQSEILNYPCTYEFNYGLRFKLKIFEFLSTGIDAHINFQNFNLKYSFDKNALVSDGTKERICLTNIGNEAYVRFSLAKHGNTIGKYIDFGGWTDFPIFNRYITKSTFSTVNFKQKIKITRQNVDYFLPYFYGVSMRLGFTRFALYAKYRLSDILNPDKFSAFNNDFSRMSVGIEFAIVH